MGRFNLKLQFRNDYTSGTPAAEFGIPTRMRLEEQQISLDYGSHKRFFINLYVKQAALHYEEEDYIGQYNLTNLDRRDLQTGLTLNKTIFTRTRLLLTFEYYKHTFDNLSGRDGEGARASLGVEFPEISLITGSFTMGYKSFQPANPGYQDYLKPFGSGNISVLLFRRLKCHVEYLVDNFYSFWGSDQQYNEKSMGLGADYYLTKTLKMGCRYRFGRLVYENSTDGITTRQDDFYLAGVSVGVKLFKNIGIGLEYNVYHSDSSESIFNRDHDFIGGYIIHEF